MGVALVRVGENPVNAVSFGKYKYNTYVVATSATGHVHRSLNGTPRFRVLSPAADVT